ncbi:MAG: hypothetical protein ACK4YM_05880 [Novosphingobium sp.]
MAQEIPAQAAPVPAAAPAAAPVLPGNKVQCVYDYMTAEDREMALLLFAREITDGGRFSKSSPNVRAVGRLIEEAHEKCLARFNWSVARSDAAMGYALAAVLLEGLTQAIETFGYPIEPLNGYLAENRARLILNGANGRAEQDQLSLHLKENGWEKASPEELTLAGLYLEMRLLQDRGERRFGAFSGPVRQPIRKQPARAGKAKRGRP